MKCLLELLLQNLEAWLVSARMFGLFTTVADGFSSTNSIAQGVAVSGQTAFLHLVFGKDHVTNDSTSFLLVLSGRLRKHGWSLEYPGLVQGVSPHGRVWN